jgi:hypothetical protein
LTTRWSSNCGLARIAARRGGLRRGGGFKLEFGLYPGIIFDGAVSGAVTLSMKWFKTGSTLVAATVALMLQAGAPAAIAADLLALAKQLARPAHDYPELTQINNQVSLLITRMETNTAQLKEYRKARIRATDRRYAALTREFNQSRSRLSEIERKLEKASSLDSSRFPAPPGSDRGSSSSDVRDRALAGENAKYDQAKASLRQSLKALSDHYDQQLHEIAKLR